MNPVELNPAELNLAQRVHLRYKSICSLRYSTGLQDYENRDANARVQQIEQEIFAVDVIDVAIVGVSPAYRPRVDELKAVAAVLKLRLARDDYGLGAEGVAAAEVRLEFIVGNAPTLAGLGARCCFASPDVPAFPA